MRSGIALAATLLALSLPACVVNPVSGERELSLVSPAQEQALGRDADLQVVAQYGLVDDPGVQGYVQQVGLRLARASHVPDQTFTFRVLDDPVVNAFALPGGYVYLTRGILAELPSEAAMAGVLGHEIGHVAARHGAQRMTRQILYGAAFGLAGSLLGERAGRLVGLLGIPAQLFLLKYSRDDERQADELGVEYASALGYDTTDMAAFFQTLGRLSARSGSSLPAWASTHPDPGERSRTVLELTRRAQEEQERKAWERGRDALLDRVDGLVYGDNPRHGFTRGGSFLHPDLRVRFPVPQGWTLKNSASEVVLSEPGGKALVVFRLATQVDERAAASAWLHQDGVRLQERAPLRVEGDPAERVWTTVQGEQGTLAAVSTFVTREGRVFAFHGLTAQQDMPRFEATLVAVADGFARLTDPQALAIQPVRLHVVGADRTATFAELARGYPAPALAHADLERLALLNGLRPGDTVQRGTRLKVLIQR